MTIRHKRLTLAVMDGMVVFADFTVYFQEVAALGV
jgi:hypothetical protein